MANSMLWSMQSIHSSPWTRTRGGLNLVGLGLWTWTQTSGLQNCYGYFQGTPISAANLSCISSQSMYRRKHSALLQFCLYVFPHVKPPSQPPNHFHMLLQISGTHCRIICHSFQLFLLLEELSNITCSCWLTLTVVRNLVRSNQLNLSRFVIHRQLLPWVPSHSPEIPCRPSKGVPSERL